MNIKEKKIGHPCFIVAELGLNHYGSYDEAKKLVDVAATGGADAVTVQLIDRHNLSSDKAVADLLSKLELTIELLQQLVAYANSKNLIFGAAVLDEKSLKIAVDLKAAFIKTVSGEISNLPLIRAISNTRIPYFISTGASDLKDIETALNEIKDKNNIVLIHTTTQHPTPPENLNIYSIQLLKQKFDCIVGYCDHSREPLAVLSAVACGAEVIEKYIITDRELKIADFQVSAEPEEFKDLVHNIRKLESILGKPGKDLSAYEKDVIKRSRRSFHASKNILKGNILTEDMVVLKRPGTGIPYTQKDTIVGRIAVMDIVENEMIDISKLK
jgi:sialic acid synthase SpsE